MEIKVGIVDDHQLFGKSLSMLLSSFQGFEVVMDAIHGQDLQEKLKNTKTLPDIMLIDVAMPVMDGFKTAHWLHEQFPDMLLVALSMNDQEQSIREMLASGCCAFLFKDTHPDELERALREVKAKRFYNGNLQHINISKWTRPTNAVQFVPREIEFLQLACGDMTYKQIANILGVSERTIDSYRETLFFKLKVQSRTGMVLEAFRRGLVKF